MIQTMHIIAWKQIVPWPEQRQVEQDLIISRALIELFSDDSLKDKLRFRGGTALNKLHFPEPLRYSEDIDLVRTESGPIGPVLDQIRQVLEPWLGRAVFVQSDVAPKLRFKVPAEDKSGDIRLKVEINTREIDIYDQPHSIKFSIENPWFSGVAEIPTFTHEEMLATKLRALLQRDKGRDLFDLAHALDVFNELNKARVVEYFHSYLKKSDLRVSRAEAERRMFSKLREPGFISDMRPLVAPAAAEKLTDEKMLKDFVKVFQGLIIPLPGGAWQKTEEMIERFGLAL